MFPQDSFEDVMKPGREAFEYWISFFPTAPMFGVKWRFEGMMPGVDQMMNGMDAFTTPMSGFTPSTAPKAAAAPKPATKAAAPAKAAAKTVSEAPAPKAEAAPVAPVAEAPAPAKAKPAPKKAAAPAENPAPVKAEKAPAKPQVATKAETAAKAETPAKKAAPKAKDGKPEGLFADKPAKTDDLKLINGVGPGLERELNGLGIYHFSQMAAFTKADLTWVDDNLTAFKGRCFRDDWIGQAKALMG